VTVRGSIAGLAETNAARMEVRTMFEYCILVDGFVVNGVGLDEMNLVAKR
jgi:hypothetical protein